MKHAVQGRSAEQQQLPRSDIQLGLAAAENVWVACGRKGLAQKYLAAASGFREARKRTLTCMVHAQDDGQHVNKGAPVETARCVVVNNQTGHGGEAAGSRICRGMPTPHGAPSSEQ